MIHSNPARVAAYAAQEAGAPLAPFDYEPAALGPHDVEIDFAARHGIGAQVETLPMSEVNTALAGLRRNDVRYRFVLSRN